MKDNQFICSFKIGFPERIYSIYLVTELDEVEEIGETDYQKAKVKIKNLDSVSIQKTVIHELVHVWLYEMGHNQAEKQFTNEDVCEIVASSYDFIAFTLMEFMEQYNKLLGKHSKE